MGSVQQRLHRVFRGLPHGDMTFATSMQHQVKSSDDGKLVGGQRSIPIDIWQISSIPIYIHRYQVFCLGHVMHSMGGVRPGRRVIKGGEPTDVVEYGADTNQFPIDYRQ